MGWHFWSEHRKFYEWKCPGEVIFPSSLPRAGSTPFELLGHLGGQLSFSLAIILKTLMPWFQCSNKTKCISSPSSGRASRAALIRHLVEEAVRGCLCFNANLAECENQVSAASLFFHTASWWQSAWGEEEERTEMIVELCEGFLGAFETLDF